MRKKKDKQTPVGSLRSVAEGLLKSEKPESGLPPNEADSKRLLHELRVHQVELEMQNEELRRAQIETEESRAKYTDLYDFAPVGYLTLNEQGLISQLNLAAAQLLGSDRALLVNKPFSRFVRPESPFYGPRWKEVLQSSSRGSCELVLKGQDGKPIDVHIEYAPSEIDQIRVIRIILTDITERRRIEEKIRRSEQRYRSYIEVTGQLAWTTDAQGGVVEDLPIWRKFTGQSEEEIMGAGWAKALHPDDTERALQAWNHAVTTKSPYEVEYRVRKNNGAYRRFLANGLPVLDHADRVSEWVGTCTDITERKEIENAQKFLVECGWSGKDFLQELALYLAETLGADYVCIDRLEGECFSARTVAVYFDGKFEDNVTYTLKDTPCGAVVGKTICSFPEGVRHLFPQDALLQEMLAESYVGTTLWGSQGQPIGLIALISRKPLANPRLAESILKLTAVRAAGELERRQAADALSSARDDLELRVQERTAELQAALERLEGEIAERKKIGEQLLQAQKLEALGTMAGGVAHDFNNILAAMLGFAELAIEDIPPGGPGQKSLEHILKSVHRGRELVKQILTFSRKAENIRSPMALAPVINETFELLRVSIPANVEIVPRITATSDAVIASPVEVQQILMNLAKNGALAMHEKGGILEISLSNINLSPESPLLHLGITAGEYVELAVSDTGSGMSPDLMARIFDPFFTTREKGSGTGMGLAAVYGIVKTLGGAITVESEQGAGSTFRIFLPKTNRSAETKTASVEQRTQGTERILFVEDESQLAEWGQTALERMGYGVTTASDGAMALRIFSADPSRFDLVITDQMMPKMNGLPLAQKILEIRSDLPIILCTGHDASASAELAKASGVREYLEKPLSRQELAEAIRRALDEKVEA